MPLNVPAQVPAGVVDYFAAGAVPAGYLECNGAAISRTVYAALFAAIGTTYGAGDGATTFNIPDCRGEFIRGWDNGRGVDSARAIGTAQAESRVVSHVNAAGSVGVVNPDGSTAVGSSSAMNGSGVTTAKTEYGVRPRNVAMLTCIKF